MAENLDIRDPLKSARLLLNGQFKFRRLSEAKDLSEYLAAACPNPTLSAIGLCEIFLNAIEHGNLAIGFDEKTKLQSENNWLEEIDKRLSLPENIHKFVFVEFNCNEIEISIKVTDQGNGATFYSCLVQVEKCGD